MPTLTKMDLARGRPADNLPTPPNETDHHRNLKNIIDERFKPENQDRLDLERRWSVNGAFIQGKHWISWDNEDWRVIARPVPKRQILEKRNFVAGLHERAIAALTGFNPEFKVRPNTADHEDIQAARVGSDCAQHYYQALEMEYHIQMATSWSSQTGTGYLGVEWDPSKGDSWMDVAVDQETGEVILDEDGQPQLETYHEGDLVASSPSPFNIYVDPHATRDEDVQWMLHVSQVPLEWVWEHYPEEAPYVRSDQGQNQENADNDNFGEARRHHRWMGSEIDEGWTLRYVMYEKPGPVHKRGRMVVRCGDVICQDGENPMPDGSFPWVALRKVIVNGAYHGRTEISDSITPQINLNRLASKQLEHSMMHGLNTKVLMHGDRSPDAQFVSGVGEVIYWRGAPQNKPDYLAPPSLPADSDKQMTRAENHLDRVSGMHGAEQGIYQGKLSGDAYEILVEQSMQQKYPAIARWRMALGQWGKKVLLLCQKYIDDERTLKITGQRNAISHRVFSGADIKNNVDCYVTIESMLPRSRAIAVSEVTRLFQSGAFDPTSPHDKATGRQIIGLEDPEQAKEQMDYHREKAEREYLEARDGVPINPHDPIAQDIDVHVETHREQVNREEFELWPVEHQNILLGHLYETVQMALPQPGSAMPPEVAQSQGPAQGEM